MKTVVQLYIPPKTMIGKDFLKEIFANRKCLLKLSELKTVNVPKYDELSVKQVYPMIKNDPQLNKFFPDKYPKGRIPDRVYTFNVLNSLKPKYVSDMIKHAQTQRNAVTEKDDHNDEIYISKEWQE